MDVIAIFVAVVDIGIVMIFILVFVIVAIVITTICFVVAIIILVDNVMLIVITSASRSPIGGIGQIQATAMSHMMFGWSAHCWP